MTDAAPERIWLDWSDDQKPEWVHQLLAFKEGIELDGEQASIPYVPEAALTTAQARIAELEAALALRTGADHDPDCKAHRDRSCNCGHDQARRALKAKP